MMNALISLKNTIKGEVRYNSLYKVLYSTDASAYREIPKAVVFPKDEVDIEQVILFTGKNNCSIIPRTAGTSLAGQVVGGGIIVDVSKYMNKILEINNDEKWVRVQPGVVLDQLNIALKETGLFFAPETSTSNRCCIGGMIGNNSCGSHSLVYGSTREHLIEAECLLYDGSRVVFKELNKEEAVNKSRQPNLEGRIYKEILSIIDNVENQLIIEENFPDSKLSRRNSGYAIDIIKNDWLTKGSINLCKLLSGSEGTLAFVVEAKLNLVNQPPKNNMVICVHCDTLNDAFKGNLVALKHSPAAVELMDRNILELSKTNISQNKNRFFIKGDPAAILIIELVENTIEEIEQKAEIIEQDLIKHGCGYHYPKLYGDNVSKVWSLRKAGLGLLSTMPGDAKPVSLIEDTAVLPEKLSEYINDISKMLASHGLECVYHGHISTGELHLRPILNLKLAEDIKKFKTVAYETTLIVKKYRGSISGEHGDGRLRSEFIPLLFGEAVYNLFIRIKKAFDPDNRFNPGKIVYSVPMESNLRYIKKDLNVATYFDFSEQKGFLTAIEQCNGSGDCRKPFKMGGLMCPTYKVTNDERFSTRARANIMREYLINPQKKLRFSQPEVLELLEDCISCKGCKSECPSNVDLAAYKAEYLQHHYDETYIPFNVFLIANLTSIEKVGAIIPGFYNKLIENKFTAGIIKYLLRFAKERDLPKLHRYTLINWYKRNYKETNKDLPRVYLFVDEFTNYQDVEVGISFIELLSNLGYHVIVPEHVESGRTEISKGLLKKAKRIAKKNIQLLRDVISDQSPLVGIEPSCILSFRDEYLKLADELKDDAIRLSKNVFLYDEFIVGELKKNKIRKEQFKDEKLDIFLHGHCHQKSLASVEPSRIMLSIPENYQVTVIPSGCCGMAGAYGYEKKHYEMSMKIGEEILFPTIRNTSEQTIISAPGTSCRQQIKHATGREALHPIVILNRALKNKNH